MCLLKNCMRDVYKRQVNNNYNRHANGVPQTIEELKAWAKEMNIPLEDMRTFIGEDYKGAKSCLLYTSPEAAILRTPLPMKI